MNAKIRMRAGKFARQRGAVLIVSLIFLAVLTMAAIVAMKSTTLEQRMSANVAQQGRAAENSEAARTTLTDGAMLDKHIHGRCWPQGAVPGGVNEEVDCEITPAQLTASGLVIRAEGAGLWRGGFVGGVQVPRAAGYTAINYDTEPEEIAYSKGGATANLHAVGLGTVAGVGSGARINAGYDGFGSGASAGGRLYFDIRSIAGGARGAWVATVTDYQYVMR